MIVDVSKAEELAESLLANVLPRRRRSAGIAAQAERLLDRSGVNYELLVSMAWQYDIGYAAPLAEFGFHPLDRARFLHRL